MECLWNSFKTKQNKKFIFLFGRLLSNLLKTTENLDFIMIFGQSVLYFFMLFLSNFLSSTTVIFWCVSHVEKCLSKSKQICLPEFTIFLLIPAIFLPNFRTFYQTLSNLGPNFCIFLITFSKLLQRTVYWHNRNDLKLNFSILTRKISTLNTFGT